MDKLSYYILFHHKLLINTEDFSPEEQSVFVYMAVNEMSPKEQPSWMKGKQLILEWTLPYYNPLYHINQLYHTSVYFNIFRHPNLLKKPYIGFGKFNQIMDVTEFRSALTVLESSPNVLAGCFIYPTLTYFDTFSPDEWSHLVIEPYNRSYSMENPITMNDLIQKPIFMLHTFIIPRTIFIEMMEFIEFKVFRQLLAALQWNVQHVEACMERIIGFYLAMRIHQGHFDQVIRYKVEEIEEIKEEKKEVLPLPPIEEPIPLSHVTTDVLHPFLEGYKITTSATLAPIPGSDVEWISYIDPNLLQCEPINHTMDSKKAAKFITPALTPLLEAIQPKGKKIWMTTFGTVQQKESVHRLVKDCLSTSWFSRTKAYQPQDIKSIDADFWAKHHYYMEYNPNGYGYSIWKPFFIYHTMDKMEENDIMVWMDNDTTINQKGVQPFMNYIETVRRSPAGLVVFYSPNMEKSWTKADVIHYFRLTHPNVTDSQQICSSIIIMRKCQKTMRLVEEWLQATNHYFLFNDDSSKIMNDLSFQRHNHEQSVFSLLVKRHGAEMIPDETFPPKEGYPFVAVPKFQ